MFIQGNATYGVRTKHQPLPTTTKFNSSSMVFFTNKSHVLVLLFESTRRVACRKQTSSLCHVNAQWWRGYVMSMLRQGSESACVSDLTVLNVKQCFCSKFPLEKSVRAWNFGLYTILTSCGGWENSHHFASLRPAIHWNTSTRDWGPCCSPYGLDARTVKHGRGLPQNSVNCHSL